MLTEEQIARFRANGFLDGCLLLSDDELAILRNELERVINDKDKSDLRQPLSITNLGGDDQAPVSQIVNIWKASEPYHKLAAHPEITEGIAQLTDATALRIWHDQIQYKPSEIGVVNMWHQDAPLWPIIAPMPEVTAWIALDDADESNGCMSMVPGSHLWGNNIDFLREMENYEAMPANFSGHRIGVERCPVRAGEVHFHHVLTWHGSRANTSGRPRRAIALHYMTQDARYVASGDHVMKPYVDVNDGEVMSGDAFPLVYRSCDR